MLQVKMSKDQWDRFSALLCMKRNLKMICKVLKTYLTAIDWVYLCLIEVNQGFACLLEQKLVLFLAVRNSEFSSPTLVLPWILYEFLFLIVGMLNYGTVPISTKEKMDAIHIFAREGELDNLLKCIESGVSVHLQDSEGRTPMHWAVDRGHLKIAEALLSRNANVNAKDNEGQTPLHYAVMCEREDIAKFLVKQNADKDTKDNDGNSPVDLCDSDWPWLQRAGKAE
ncbi:acyl-CoA-binding domain-containing protein 1-like [Gossypium australe]|uniref:Acyl-CoA-binding domain-containing protein 1-like n=1 Tax=Gossypium australe TaxID=47621 RepID=A0A5B6UE85_9ROSI|nr:acyl-CoA-binding domain-containing protein 1-like [Gossypium australe]